MWTFDIYIYIYNNYCTTTKDNISFYVCVCKSASAYKDNQTNGNYKQILFMVYQDFHLITIEIDMCLDQIWKWPGQMATETAFK